MARQIACTTIVSAPMADDIARARGIELRRTLTGFKFIGEQVGVLEREGREGDFLMGFEESYGYLAGTSVRDKDAVVASMLICELAAHWKKLGLDLYEAMERLYETYGQRLPMADVLEYRLADGSRVLFRPSGTEPKAKAYVFAKGSDRAESEERLATLVADAKSILGGTR